MELIANINPRNNKKVWCTRDNLCTKLFCRTINKYGN